MSEKELAATIARLQEENERLRDSLNKIRDWAKAYPVDIFPEPDFQKAAHVLKENGMYIDTISASNYRHILNSLCRECVDALKL